MLSFRVCLCLASQNIATQCLVPPMEWKIYLYISQKNLGLLYICTSFFRMNNNFYNEFNKYNPSLI